MRRSLSLLSGLVVVTCLLSGNAVAQKRPPLKHVTIFGDSVAAAFDWVPQARAEVEKGNRVTFELQPCGRLSTPGCISPPPPSVLSEVRTLGRRIGPTAVILVGYNDDPHVYRSGIDTVLRAMRRRGVKQALWLTLRDVVNHSQYFATNQVIRGATRRFPYMLTVVNWAGYSRSHPEWFASDGIHFTSSGAVQFATYLHQTLRTYGLTGPIGSTSG